MRFGLAFALITLGILSFPWILVGWTVLPMFLAIRCTGSKAVSEQWSEDKAFKAVLYLDHCPGAYTPSTDAYHVGITALPGFHSRSPGPYSDYGWYLPVHFADETSDNGPVTIAWPDRRTLDITVQTEGAAGTLTRTNEDLVVRTTYTPRPPPPQVTKSVSWPTGPAAK